MLWKALGPCTAKGGQSWVNLGCEGMWGLSLRLLLHSCVCFMMTWTWNTAADSATYHPPHIHAAVTTAVKTAEKPGTHRNTCSHLQWGTGHWTRSLVHRGQGMSQTHSLWREELQIPRELRMLQLGWAEIVLLRQSGEFLRGLGSQELLGPSKQRVAGQQTLESGVLGWSESLDLHSLLWSQGCPDCVALICNFNTIMHICNSLPFYIPVMWDAKFLGTPQ